MKLFRLFFAILLTGLFAAGCDNGSTTDNNDGGTAAQGSIELTADRELICADGEDFATFSVFVKTEDGSISDITDEAEIYISATDELIESDRFSTTVKGDYSFYAAYGLNITDEITISAVDVIPELPEDPQEDAFDFRHRMLLVQHTGAECSNCPRMMNSLKALSEDAAYNTLYTHVASHAYLDGQNDAAYSPAAKTLSAMFNSGAYPELTFNLTNTSTGTEYNEICTQINTLKKESVSAGIAMAVEHAEGEIIANVEFKTSEAKTYRIGAWLLEDNIFARQAGATESWHHYHNNALRAMHGNGQIECIYGTVSGNVEAGTKIQKFFRFPLEDSYIGENCKVLVFVTAADASGNYDIVNSVVCKVGESVSYDYK